jgi:hypothetical protein
MNDTITEFTIPDAAPGDLTISGNLTPASYNVVLEFRKGAPLSLTKITRVF